MRALAALAALAAVGALGGVLLPRLTAGGAANSEPSVASPSSAASTPNAGASTTTGAPVRRRVRAPWPIPGYLLIADRGNNRVLLIDSRRRVLWRYPRPGQVPSFPFVYDDDAFFGNGYHSIISQQEDQHTIQVISFPAGRVVWHYGHPNRPGSAAGYLNTPDDAYLLHNGIRMVADVRNCRIVLISKAGNVVRQFGTTGVCGHDPPRLLGSPNGDTPLPGDRGLLVSEINGSWIDAISMTGKLLWSFRAPVAYPSDAQPLSGARVLLADYSSPGHVLITDHRGHTLWKYGPASGAGALDHPSLALMLPHGIIAVNDDFRHRVVLLSVRKHRIIWQYGHTDRAGSGPGYLNIPDGMDFLPWRIALRQPALRSVIGRPG